MKVLLLHLPLCRPSYLSFFSLPEPLAHLYLSRVLSPHKTRFIDLRLTPKLEKELRGFDPDIALVGVNPLTLPSLDKTLHELKKVHPKTKIVLFAEAEYGNNHISERPLDFVHPEADALVAPLYLAVLRKVAREAVGAIEKGWSLDQVPGLWVKANANSWKLTQDVPNEIADVETPDRSLLGKYRGRYRFGGIGEMAHIFYTYGCQFKCRFCPMSKHDGSMYVRNLSQVVQELSEITEPNVFLQDYEPFLAPQAMHALAEALEKTTIRKNYYMLTRSDTVLEQTDLIARWQKLGLRWIYLGLDGHSTERLKELRKANTVENNQRALRLLESMGIGVSTGFLVRSDFDQEDFKELDHYVSTLRPKMVDFTVETPLVGTRLFDESEKFLTTHDWSLYDLQHATLPTKMPLKNFYREMFKLHLKAGKLSLRGMVQHMSWKDCVRNWVNGPRALWTVWKSPKHHQKIGLAKKAF